MPEGSYHPTANRAQCSATALIETNALLLHQTATTKWCWGNKIVYMFVYGIYVAAFIKECACIMLINNKHTVCVFSATKVELYIGDVAIAMTNRSPALSQARFTRLG